jgi:hypothetical protein
MNTAVEEARSMTARTIDQIMYDQVVDYIDG